MSRLRIESLSTRPLAVALKDPFVIATGRVDFTRSVLVTVELVDLIDGRRVTGYGEAATLPPVTREDEGDVARVLEAVTAEFVGRRLPPELDTLEEMTDGMLGDRPSARAGLETALLDGIARAEGLPLRVLLGGAAGAATRELVTDITIPILPPERMVELARGWWELGFTCFKVKVGKDLDTDLRALEAIHSAVDDASFRIDANEGFSAAEAIRLLKQLHRLGVRLECLEQPCRADDLDGMAEVTAFTHLPVVADESVKTMRDLERCIGARACSGVNLKLVKSGGPLSALRIGRFAKSSGLPVMVGGMVETRLGMTAAANVAAALGGVSFPDLDTAWLLREDPFAGGYEADGPRYVLPDGPGLGLEPRG